MGRGVSGKGAMKRRWFLNRMLDSSDYENDGGPLEEVLELEANLIGSRLANSDLHLPVLDIDFPARLIPSTTEGHFHLYLDGMAPLTWPRYKALLEALSAAGVIHPGYLSASVHRGQSLVRKPGVKKLIPTIFERQELDDGR